MLKWILFDLNSFFASCEQQEDPSIRGKPVAVIPTMTNSTSVIAASIEAKRMGVKTNTSVRDAKKMCPGIIFKTGNHRLYTEYHQKIKDAIGEVLPIKKTLSIDEFSIELLGVERQPEKARQLAQQLKDHVRFKVGSEIKSSVGIGPNILVAKMASDMQKPDGLIMISTEQILEKLGPLPISDLPGVGKKMKYNLNAKGYFTVADFIKTPEQELRQHWGSIWGLRVARELRGEDIPLHRNPIQNSISHQHVLPPDLRSLPKAFSVASKLLIKACFRMRNEKLRARRLSVYVKSVDEQRFENSISFAESFDTYFLTHELQKLWTLKHPFKPIKVAIILSDLVSGPDQLSLFDNPKQTNINHALDSINNKYGHNTLYLGGTQSVLGSAKTRIAFNHIPELSDEFDD